MSSDEVHPPKRSATSSAQDRLWFLNQASEAPDLYNIPLVLELTGSLDRVALELAFLDVLERHEILRTTLSDAGDEIEQVVHAVSSGMARFEHRRISARDIEAVIENFVHYVFDLEREFPIRVTLLEVAADRHIFMLLMHHIAGDGWSFEPLLRHLWKAYAARLRGVAPDWAPLPVQYADYAKWQKRVLGDELDPGSMAAQQLNYWTEELRSLPEQLDLPTDRPRPAVASHQGGVVRITLNASQHKALISIARSAKGSLFMVLQSALAALLTRLGAGKDIPLGSPIAGRSDEQLYDLVGLFLNVLVLRTDTSGNPRFSDLVVRVVDKCLAGFENSDLPFDRVVEAINPVRSSTRHPLFQIMLVLQNNAKAPFDFPSAKVRVREASTKTSKFDLTFYFNEDVNADGTPGGLHGHLEYATDLFDVNSANAIVDRYLRLLDAVCTDPDTRIGEIELLSAEERRRILVDWNNTARPLQQKTVATLFEAQAEALPVSPAVLYDDRQLSYAEINLRANQLAHALIARGIGPEDIVGICQQRTPDMIVSLLGIFKAGAAYLPLDPDYPMDRLNFMLHDARPVLVLTHTESEHSIPTETATLALDNPTTRQLLASQPTRNPIDKDRKHPIHLQTPAYMIYTSGSTGTPKGVLGTNLCLANRIAWDRSSRNSNASLMKTSISFIDSIWEVFSSLTVGQPVVVAKCFEDLFANDVSENLREDVNLRTAFVPSVLHKLARTSDVERSVLSKVSSWNLGGEKLFSHQADEIKSVFPGKRVINTYGASEFWDATFFDLAENNPYEHVPIGRPIDNAEVYILDEFLNPCPPNVLGVLFVAGNGLARGYSGRFALTASHFVPNPFKMDGSRMYRTGDIGCWRSNGTIEYVGRSDDQVKIHGFRVETGEIEATLMRHSDVKDAAVVARPDANGENQLVAYYVAEGKSTNSSEDVRQFVSSILPQFMVPAHFQRFDILPRTQSGKLDRKSLPAPDEQVSVKTEPRNMREIVVAEIFAEILAIENISVTDNFFNLGGHSLLALIVLAEIRTRTGINLTLTAFYERPTVEYVASKLHGLMSEHQGEV